MTLIWLSVYCWTGGVIDCSSQCTVELIVEAETYSLYVREHSLHRRSYHTDQVETRTSVELRCDSWLLWRRDPRCWRDAALDCCLRRDSWSLLRCCSWLLLRCGSWKMTWNAKIALDASRRERRHCLGCVSGLGTQRSLRIFGRECPRIFLRLDLRFAPRIKAIKGLLRMTLSFTPLIKAIGEPINRLSVLFLEHVS